MWSNLAVEAKERENASEAELFFKKAVDIEPNFTTGHMNLGYLYKQENRTQEAIEVSKLLYILSKLQYTVSEVSILLYILSKLQYTVSEVSILLYILSRLQYTLAVSHL